MSYLPTKNELLSLIDSQVNNRGAQIWLKTNLGPAIKIYDADTPGGGSFIKAGVFVTDRNHVELASYGGKPPTNWVYAGALGAITSLATFIFLRGIKGLKK